MPTPPAQFKLTSRFQTITLQAFDEIDPVNDDPATNGISSKGFTLRK